MTHTDPINIFPITPRIIAHRGASAQAPENTPDAFLKAKSCGLKWVEFDVMLTQTDELLVIHDEELMQEKNNKKEPIPSLKSILDLLYECKLFANLEIKPNLLDSTHREKIVKNIWAVLQTDSRYKDIPILFSSFSITCLSILRKMAPHAEIGVLLDTWDSNWNKHYASLSPVSFHLNHEILTLERVAEIKAKQYAVLAYTVNDSMRMKELFSWGVDAVFSDCSADFLMGIKKD